MPHFFLSHAAADATLAKRFDNLLRLGCGVREREIFCTSVEGAGVGAGEQFTHQIREHLNGSDLAIFLVTRMWWNSPFCIAEMGAAWSQAIPVFPLVIPGLPRELGANMLGTQTRALDSGGLDELRDVLAKIHPEGATSTEKWTFERDTFLADLPPLLTALRHPDHVPRADLTGAQAQLEQARDATRAAREETAALQAYIEELEAAKDAQAVRDLRLAHSDAETHYRELVSAAREALRPLSEYEVHALFATVRGKPWRPGDDVWTFDRANIEASINGDRIRSSGGGYEADEEHPIMEAALTAVNTLGEYLEDQAPPELLATIRETQKVKPEITNLDYWNAVLTGRWYQ